MLQLDPLFTVNRVTVFGDHAKENQLYYLPENVRISTDAEGKPAFTMLKYMRDITDNPAFSEGQQLGGGFCIFTVDLSLDEETERAIVRQARRQGISRPSLAVAPFREGTVRLVGLDANVDPEDGQVRFVENVQGTAVPSLYGDLRATFSVRLSQEAAELVEEAFEKGGAPFGVVYELKFLGLRPAFDVTVKANYKRIYDEFSAQLGAQYMLLRAEIEAGFQKLQEEQAIDVVVHTFTDDADARTQRDEALRYFKEDLLKDFFTSSLPVPQEASSDILGGLGSALQLPQMAGRSLSSAQSGASVVPSPPASYGQPARTPPAPPPATSGGPTAGATPAGLRTAESGSPAEAPTAPRSSPPPAPTAETGGGGAGGGGGNLLQNMAIGFKLKFMRQEELKTFEGRWRESSAVERTHAPNGTFGLLLADLDRAQHFMEVDLDSTFFQRLKVDVETPVPFQELGLRQIKAHLEYGDRGDGEPRHVDDLELRPPVDGQRPEPQIFTCSLDRDRSLHYRYRLDFFFDPTSKIRGQKTHYTTDSFPTFDRTLTIDPNRYIGFLKVEATLGEIDPMEIERVQLRLGYDDDANDFHVQDTFVLSQQQATVDWKVRLTDPELREYWYEIVYFLKQGDQRIEMPRQTSSSGTLVIHEPWADRIDLALDAIFDETIARMVVEITYEDEDVGYRFSSVKRILAGEDGFSTLSIPLMDPDKREYRYRITTVRPDNSIQRGDLATASGAYLPLTAPVPA